MARLDEKLARIIEGRDTAADFIIADAKDGDMGFGRMSPGPQRGADGRPGGGLKTFEDHLDQIEAIVRQDVVDIMLTSVGTLERLQERGVYENSAVTPAVRLNDTSDIWGNRHGRYRETPSRPFRSARLSEVDRLACPLGLYSMTFTNSADDDVRTLEAFRAFREDLAAHRMRWFLEVFNPNVECGIPDQDVGRFVNDWIVRALAGLTGRERPAFLKIVYNGADALSELVSYDRRLVVGILGGSAGTTCDTYTLLSQGARNGAKVALFGRKINLAESPLDLVAAMPPVVQGTITPAEAVRQYHDALKRQGIPAARSLDDDLAVTDPLLKAETGG